VRSILVLVLTLFATAASAQLLKCIGKDGRVEYAAQCPAGTHEQSTGIRSTAPAAASTGTSASTKSLAEKDAEFRKRQAAQQDAQTKEAKKSADEALRQRACDDARAYLKNLQSGNRIVSADPKTGERVYLEDSQYPAEIAAAQRSIEMNCK
jgi:hypothetical protein